MLTLQSVNGPCLKLFKRNFGRWWQHIEVQSVLVVLLLELGIGKLPSLVVQVCASLRIDSGVIVADHFDE
jgi:hypothetical protein